MGQACSAPAVDVTSALEERLETGGECDHAGHATSSAELVAAPGEAGAAEAAADPADAPEDGWADQIVNDAEAEAVALMRDVRVLEAEAVLAKALGALEQPGGGCSGPDPHGAPGRAAARLRASRVYAEVAGRAAEYDAFARVLAPAGFRLAWESEGSCLWVHAPPGATWFEYKLVCKINAPVSHYLAYGNEHDLLPQHEPMLVGEPRYLGRVHPLLLVSRSLMGILGLRVELLFEVLRFFNHDYGFLAERISSAFPREGRPIPRKAWGTVRLGLRTQNLWIPVGGSEPGTIGVQLARVEVGFRISEAFVGRMIKTVASSLVRNLQQNTERVGQPGSPYWERLALDKHGLYAACGQMEAAAKRRGAISTTRLPSTEILCRPWSLPPPSAES